MCQNCFYKEQCCAFARALALEYGCEDFKERVL